MPPLFWQFDKFAAGNAFPISGFVAFGTGVLGGWVCWVCRVVGWLDGWMVGWLGGWVVGIRYRRGPSLVPNMDAVLKKASWGTRRIFGSIRCKKQAFTVRKGYSVPETPFYGTE